QSIADSDAELAGDMRDLVRRRIAAGEKPSAIRAWLIQRYGTWISYRPTDEPAAWPLWLAPLALLLAGAAGYAVQGSPDLPGTRAEFGDTHTYLPLAEARHAFFGYFTPAEPWL